MTCYSCGAELLERHKWTEDIDQLICNKCGKRYWWSKKLNRVLTNSEINKISEEFNE